MFQGFLKRNAYIITQMPLPHTVIDFWRMVYEHGCSSIIMLNSMEDEDDVSHVPYMFSLSPAFDPVICIPSHCQSVARHSLCIIAMCVSDVWPVLVG